MLRALIFLTALLSTLPAGAAYTSLFAFGDSLSDNGNAFALSQGLWPPSPPYAGQFSNGPVAVERLAADLKVPLQPSSRGGTDFAVGGATSGTKNYNYEVRSPFPLPSTLQNTGVLAQVGSFAAARPAFDPGQTLFTVWAGANDLFLALDRGGNPADATASAIRNLATAVGQLAGIGARHLLVPNLPNLAETPFGLAQDPAERAGLDALSQGFNGALAKAIALLDALPGVDVTSFDTAAFLHKVEAKPGDFGFSHVADPCFNPAQPTDVSGVAGGCKGYLFFDSFHPTSAAHALLGDGFFAALPIPEPSTGSLAALALIIWLAFRPLSAASRADRSTA